MTAPSPLALTSLRPLLSLAPPLLVTHLPPSVTVAKSPNKASPKGTSPNKGKGKATPTTASPSAVSTTLSSPSKQAPGEEDNDLLDLAESITGKAHLLIPGLTDDTLVRRAQEVVKASFDRALASESLSFPHLQTLLRSLTPSSGPSTRSQARAAEEASALDDGPALSLPLTPLEELTVEGMDPEMVWEQMEMRSAVVVELLDEMFGGGDEEDEEGGDEGDEIEDSDEEGAGFDEESSDEEDGSGDEDSDEGEDGEPYEFEESEPHFDMLKSIATDDSSDVEMDDAPATTEEDPEADDTKDLSLDNFDKVNGGRSKASRRAPGPASAIDDTFFSLHDFHVQTDEGEFEMARALRGEVGSDDEEGGEDDIDLFAAVDLGGDEDEENLDEGGIMYKDFFEPPPRPLAKDKKDKKGKGKGKGRPAPTDDDASEPTPAPKPAADGDDKKKRRASVRFSEAVKVKLIAPRGSEFEKLVKKVGYEEAERIFEAREAGEEEAMEDEDEEDGEEALLGSDEEEGEEGEEEDEDIEMEEGEERSDEEGSGGEEGEFESDDDEGQETIERLKTSLFDDDEGSDDESSPAASMSRHERRLLALSSQIAALEAENVGVKNWATKGEAKARDRPTNSLLDEDLEYERSGKVVPVITEETTKTIEDLIKKRILDNNFDDVVRQRAVDPNAFLPSRFMELQDSKSNKSLAEIYEEDYQSAKDKEEGRTTVNELDKDLEDKHAEIEDLFDELSGKLDALSNARFTPKPPKATISTIANLPSITLESALPTATSASTMLAPEEVFVPDPTAEDRSSFTPAQKKAARQKRRKARASMAAAADKFVKGAKGEKERAVKELVGTKGVTVIGKGGKVEKGTKRKRGDDDGRTASNGVGLKL